MSNEQPVLTYYNELATGYDADRFGNSYGRYLHRQETMLLARLLKNNTGAIADLGCGTGRLTEFAQTGIDFSEAMLEEARKKWPSKNFIQASLTHLPFDNNSMDVLFSFHVFMHMDESSTKTAFAEIERVLKPGGLFIFDFPSARRRKLTGHQREGWHGSTAYDAGSLQIDGLSCHKHFGLLFFPVHRLPVWARKLFRPVDTLLCRSPFKNFASYQLAVFRKP